MSNSRRRFFTGLMKAAAIVALAPQLAFRAKSDKWILNPEWEKALLNQVSWNPTAFVAKWKWVSPSGKTTTVMPFGMSARKTV